MKPSSSFHKLHLLLNLFVFHESTQQRSHWHYFTQVKFSKRYTSMCQIFFQITPVLKLNLSLSKMAMRSTHSIALPTVSWELLHLVPKRRIRCAGVNRHHLGYAQNILCRASIYQTSSKRLQ